jgi:ATP-dependent helicase/nuclease subunit A
MAAAMTRLTPQQERAITTREVSIALAAGAGCGKTFVLTERFLSCLDPARPGGPLRLDQLTAITFTERAAREMRQRIRTACTQRLLDAPPEYVDYWLRTVRELDSARIATIHSFCGALLRSHAVEARLDPHFQVLDAAATQTVLYELIDEELRQRLAAGDNAVIDLVVKFGLPGLREMVGRLLGERQQIDWETWRGETPGRLLARWEDFWRSDTLPRILARVSKSRAAGKIMQVLGEETPTNAVMRERGELLCAKLPQLPAATDPAAALAEIREAAQVLGGGGKAAWSSEEVYDAFRDSAEELRAMIDKLAGMTAFDPAAALPAAEAALGLLAVTHGLAGAFQQRKTELAALDFDDLLIRARDLIAGEARADFRKHLAAQTRLLLVDEFQDTDPLQVELVRALCDGRVADGKLFFVGDYKQSIYRFRGADPRVFRLLRDEVPAHGRLPLTLNFRSQPAVIEFVNALFCAELGPEYEALETHRPQLGPRPAVEFLWAIEPESGTGSQPVDASSGADAGLGSVRPDRPRSPTDPSDAGGPGPAVQGDGPDASQGDAGRPTERNRRREAEWIARRLRGMLDSAEELVCDQAAGADGPALRAVRPGDVTLLFRALTDVEYYEEALRRHGIDYYLVGGHAFYAQQEIYDIVDLLRAVASPCDEVSLAGVLRSPMFSLLDETLYRLSKHEGGLSSGFWSSLGREQIVCGTRSVPDALLAPEEQTRLRFAAETLGELRDRKDRMPIAELLHLALEKTGYDALLLAEFLGERKLANLHKLIEQARQFDAAGIFTLADFITQLAQFVARQPDEPLAPTQPESINAVRLMSIHQSKGLEFPVVVVVDVDRPRRASTGAVAFTPQLGPMVRYSGCTSGFDLFAQAERDEELAELDRLLYVATTRAADYLILSGGLEDLDRTRGPWLDLLRRQFDISTGAVAACPPRVLAKVVCQEPPLPKATGREKRHDLHKTIDSARKLAAAGKGRIPARLSPAPPDLAARRHFSFSRLHGTIHSQAVRGPQWEEDGPAAAAPALDPLGLGTLVHAVLADLAAGGDDSPATIEALVRRHAWQHLPDSTQQLDEPLELIARMAASPRWASLRAASCVHTEIEFLLAWPPGSRDPEAPYLQGFIDCLYQDGAGDWRLLDYKTNRVSAKTLANTIQSYEMQMLVYALAVERILKRSPVEIVLHFLRNNHEHHFAWDEGARRRVVELVTSAMAHAAGPVAGQP